MRRLIAVMLAAAVIAVTGLLVGCKEEPVEEVKVTPAPDPGWPTLSVQDAAVQFDLEEAHYHMRKGRAVAPDSYGAEPEMPLAIGYAQWAYAMQVDNDKAMRAVDHLILERGSHLSVPYGFMPRCKWCGYPMPKVLTRWPVEGGEKVVECPKCGALDSFPAGLVIRCPECHDVIAGTAVPGDRCPTCGRAWRTLHKTCSRCGLQVDMLRRQGQRCPRCKARWNFDAPFGSWPTRAPIKVAVTGEGKGQPCKGYSPWNGKPCPNKTERPDGYCWLHRHQAERDKIAATPQSAGGAGAAGAAGGMGGGMGAPGGGMGGPPGGGMGMGGGPPSAGAGAGAGGGGAPPSPPGGGGGGGGDEDSGGGGLGKGGGLGAGGGGGDE